MGVRSYSISLSVWHISLSIMPSTSIHVATDGKPACSYDWVVFYWIYLPHFLHPPADSHLGSFSILAIVNNAAMNIRAHFFKSLLFFFFFQIYTQEWNCKKCQPIPIVLPGKFHGPRSRVGCSPWGCQRQTWLSAHACSGGSSLVFLKQSPPRSPQRLR